MGPASESSLLTFDRDISVCLEYSRHLVEHDSRQSSHLVAVDSLNFDFLTEWTRHNLTFCFVAHFALQGV